MEILLVLGNYMNASYGTIKGFKVSFLSKILEVKSGETGLVLLLARMILKDDERMALFIQDLKPLTENKKFSTATILEDLADFERNVTLVQKEVEASKSYHESPSYHRKDALFLKGALQFGSELSAKLEFIKRENDALLEEVRKVLHFFGEPKDSKTTIETVVEHIIKFASNFEAAIIQIREEERKNAAKSKQLPALASKPVTKPKINPTSTEQARHLDNLLENLKNKPALDSFDLLQRPKHRDAFGSEQRRFPRNNIHTPKLIPNNSKVAKPVNSFAEGTWKLLDSIDVGGLDLNFE